jgi:hypothetical protein
VAYIFLNYRGSSSLVKPFQDSLVQQGHVVYSIGDFEFSKAAALQALPQFEVVIAVWSGDAAAGDAFLAIASEALRLGRLISVRAPGVLIGALPPEFLEPPSLAVADTNGIALRIMALPMVPGPKRLPTRKRERVEGIGAAGGAPYRVAPVGAPPPAPKDTRKFSAASRKPSTADAAAEAGRLVHKIPEKMWVGEPESVEVRLGREAAAGLVDGIAGRGAITTADIPIVETMSIMLVSGGGAFLIEPQSEATQLVMNDLVAGTAFDHDEFGRWTWVVTPKKSGAQQLLLKVSAGLKDSRGVPTSVRLPDREFKVAVSVHAGKATVRVVSRAVIGLGSAVGAAFLGVVTQELWWPRIRDLLHAWGVLG